MMTRESFVPKEKQGEKKKRRKNMSYIFSTEKNLERIHSVNVCILVLIADYKIKNSPEF